MKQLVFVLAALLSVALHAQVPQGIPYQAVIRDTQGNPILNQSVTVKFTLHDQTADGAVVYEETHQTSTNSVGLFSLTFGAGVASTGNFSSINWAGGYKFLQVQTDIGNGYVDIGTQQLMSVPYALYAGTSGTSSNLLINTGFSQVSNPSAVSLSYEGCIGYCANLVESGFSDWRLPTENEVMDFLFKDGFSLANQYEFLTTNIHLDSGQERHNRISKLVNENSYNSSMIINSSTGGYKCNCVR
jgi:hypothetical protein